HHLEPVRPEPQEARRDGVAELGRGRRHVGPAHHLLISGEALPDHPVSVARRRHARRRRWQPERGEGATVDRDVTGVRAHRAQGPGRERGARRLGIAPGGVGGLAPLGDGDQQQQPERGEQRRDTSPQRGPLPPSSCRRAEFGRCPVRTRRHGPNSTAGCEPHGGHVPAPASRVARRDATRPSRAVSTPTSTAPRASRSCPSTAAPVPGRVGGAVLGGAAPPAPPPPGLPPSPGPDPPPALISSPTPSATRRRSATASPAPTIVTSMRYQGASAPSVLSRAALVPETTGGSASATAPPGQPLAVQRSAQRSTRRANASGVAVSTARLTSTVASPGVVTATPTSHVATSPGSSEFICSLVTETRRRCSPSMIVSSGAALAG